VFWIMLPLPAQAVSPAPRLPSAASGEAPRRRPPRTRILLVDDIPANQLVTATLLRREGHMVDVAGSGEAALRAVRSHPYDVVLMDVFMPGMSGPEATQHIRELPGPVSRLPIIALTANVSPDDAAMFRAAGMDDLLGKPVSLSELQGALSRHVWHTVPLAALTAPANDAARATEAAPVLSAERISELRDNLPPATFASLVEECLTDLDHRLPALRKALTAGARAAIAAQAHAMVGIAAGYGMVILEARLREIMEAAREGLPDPALAADIEADLVRSAAALRGALQQPQAA
jgi:CheY-like chemotaxis protein